MSIQPPGTSSPDPTRASDALEAEEWLDLVPGVRERVAVLRAMDDRATCLRAAKALLTDLLYIAATPDEFLRIASLIGRVEEERLAQP